MKNSLSSIYLPFFDNHPNKFLDEQILNYTYLLNDDFQKLCSNLDLEKKWSKESALNIEIKKSIIRSKLRYSEGSINLINSINNYFKKNVKDSFGLVKYFTDVYPMIHLPNDYSEYGTMHCDQIDFNRLITIWHPITDYNYTGISYISSFGFILMLIARTLKKNNLSKKNFPKFLVKNLAPKYGYTYYWGGGLPHQGNLNTSDIPSCVLVIRYTEKPHNYEKCYNINTYANRDKFDDINILSLNKIINSFFFKSEELANLNQNKLNINLLISFTKELLNQKNIFISFALSLLSQRLNKILGQIDSKKISVYLDIFSILSGNENKICEQRLIKQGFSKKTIDKLNSIF